MAKIEGYDENALKEWAITRPQVIQDMIATTPPGRLYLLKTTGQRVYPYSYNEDGTMTVIVDPKYNGITTVVRLGVFGIKPADLEECDFPEKTMNNTTTPNGENGEMK